MMLSTDELQTIFMYLQPIEILTLRRVNSTWENAVSSLSDFSWKEILHKQKRNNYDHNRIEETVISLLQVSYYIHTSNKSLFNQGQITISPAFSKAKFATFLYHLISNDLYTSKKLCPADYTIYPIIQRNNRLFSFILPVIFCIILFLTDKFGLQFKWILYYPTLLALVFIYYLIFTVSPYIAFPLIGLLFFYWFNIPGVVYTAQNFAFSYVTAELAKDLLWKHSQVFNAKRVGDLIQACNSEKQLALLLGNLGDNTEVVSLIRHRYSN